MEKTKRQNRKSDNLYHGENEFSTLFLKGA